MDKIIAKEDCLRISLMGFFLFVIPVVLLVLFINDPYGWFKSEIAKNQPTPLPTPTLSIQPEVIYPLPAEVIYSGWEDASENGICVEFNQEFRAVSRAVNPRTPEPVNLDLDLYPYVKEAFLAFGYDIDGLNDCETVIRIEVDGSSSGDLYTSRTCYGASITAQFVLKDDTKQSDFTLYQQDYPGWVISESECRGPIRKLKKVFAEALYDGLSRLFSPKYFVPLGMRNLDFTIEPDFFYKRINEIISADYHNPDVKGALLYELVYNPSISARRDIFGILKDQVQLSQEEISAVIRSMKQFDSCAPAEIFVDHIERDGTIPEYLLDIFLYSESVESRLCAVGALEALGPDAAAAVPYLIDALNDENRLEFKNEHYTLYSALKEITAGFSDASPSSRKYSDWLKWWQRNREDYPTQ